MIASSVDCPYCRRPSPPVIHTYDYNRRISNQMFIYYRCLSCRLYFLAPLPADLDRFYQSDYYAIPRSVEEIAMIAHTDDYKIDILHKFLQYGRLLDIGPSYGAFIYLASQAGFSVEAIELDADCCRFLNQKLGIHAVQSADVATALESMEQYDGITLWHVIEHLPNLWRTLRVAVEHLRPGGIIIIAAPNPDSLQFHILGAHWPHLDAPRHLELVPVSLLEQEMCNLGMQQVYITTTDLGTLRNNRFGWLINSIKLRPLRVLLRIIGRITWRAVMPFERRGLRASSYTIVFRKPL